MLFSYDLLASDGAQAIYDEMLREDAQAFLDWRARGATRSERPIAETVKPWMTTSCPRDFETVDDRLRYERELTLTAVGLVLADKIRHS